MTGPTPPRRRRIAGEQGRSTRPTSPAAAPTPAPVPPRVPVRPVVQPAAKPTVAVPTLRRSSAERESPRPRRPGRPVGRRGVILLVLAALVAAAGIVAGGLGVRALADDGADRDGAVQEATAAAATASEVVFSYRFDDLDQYAEDATALMTPSFAKDFDEVSPALSAVAPQRRVIVESSVRDAAALPCSQDCSAEKVTVLVFLDQARLIGDEPQPTVFGNRITVSMVERDGTWLVDDIRAL